MSNERWNFLAEVLQANRSPVVVDIGANPLDDPPYKPLLDAGLCRVWGFEPQKDAFDKLQAVKGPYEDYENCAVGDGETHDLHVYRQSGLTSVFPLDRRAMDFLGRAAKPATLIEKLAVETRRLDDIAAIDRIDLLKIDVQGAETMVFDHGRAKLSGAVAVISELRFYPLYEGEPLLDAQIALLADLGFRFHKFQFIKNQSIANSQRDNIRARALASQALDGDGVFVRDLRDPDQVTDAQLKALALLADAVFASYDLVLHVLDLLVARGAIAGSAPADYVTHLPAGLRRG